MRTGLHAILAASTLTLVLAGAASAQAPATRSGPFPVKPVRVLLGLAPGGGLDIMTRAVAGKLGERWGQGVVVENRPTAGGVVAMETVAQAAPDGYTWLASGSQLELTVVFHRVNFDVLKAYEPVVQMSTQPYVLMVPAALPARSLAELLALARAKPGALNYGSAGPGSLGHLGHELLDLQAGVKMAHIPYKGGGPVIPDLVAGRLQLAFMPTLSATPLLKNGTARALAVTSPRRVDSLADVPTLAESGLPEFDLANNYGLFVPARTPAALVTGINQEVTRALATPDMQAKLAADGATAPPAHPPAAYRARVEANIARWSAVVKAAGITPDS